MRVAPYHLVTVFWVFRHLVQHEPMVVETIFFGAPGEREREREREIGDERERERERER